MGASLTEKIYPNITIKACWLSMWPQANKESEQHPGQMPCLLLERGISLNLRVSGRRGKVNLMEVLLTTRKDVTPALPSSL